MLYKVSEITYYQDDGNLPTAMFFELDDEDDDPFDTLIQCVDEEVFALRGYNEDGLPANQVFSFHYDPV